MPPRRVRTVEPGGTIEVSPNRLVGPTTCASVIEIRMPSSDSQKSSPSLAGSKAVSVVSTLPFASSSIT